MDRVEFGQVLKQRRLKKGLTLEKMAEITKISLNYLSTLERGAILRPDYGKLVMVVKGYELDIEEATKAFYPSTEDLKEEEKIDEIFRDIIDDPVFKNEVKNKILTQNLNSDVKLFIIRVYENLKKKKVFKE